MVSYAIKQELRRGNRLSQSSEHKSPFQVQGRFTGKITGHMTDDCSHPLNHVTPAARKSDYLNKKKSNNAVYTASVDTCQQLYSENHTLEDASIFLTQLTQGKDQVLEDNIESGEDKNKETVILESASDEYTPKNKSSHGTCIDFGAKRTVIGLKQAKAYCIKHGERSIPNQSKRTYRFGNVQHSSVGTIKIEIPIMEAHVIDKAAGIVDIQLPLLLGITILTKLKLLPDFGKEVMSSPV